MEPELPENTPRWGLLPPGCRDLSDVLKLEEALAKAATAQANPTPQQASAPPTSIEIGDEITIKDLAFLLNERPFRIISQLIQKHIFPANADKILPFAVAKEVAEAYGVAVRKSSGASDAAGD